MISLGISIPMLARPRGGGIVTNGLVMHLDAGNAASYPGSGSTWTDLSGNGNTVTAINSPTWDSGGWFATGASGYFDRTTGINMPQGNDPYTMQAWIRYSSWPNDAGIIAVGRTENTNQGNYLRAENSTVGRFQHYWWFNDLAVSNNNASLSLNAWFMITASFDLTTRRVIANTTEVASDTPSSHNVTSNSIQVARAALGGPTLNGDIAIARIYNRALSASEVTQNFNANRGRFGL